MRASIRGWGRLSGEAKETEREARGARRFSERRCTVIEKNKSTVEGVERARETRRPGHLSKSPTKSKALVCERRVASVVGGTSRSASSPGPRIGAVGGTYEDGGADAKSVVRPASGSTNAVGGAVDLKGKEERVGVRVAECRGALLSGDELAHAQPRVHRFHRLPAPLAAEALHLVD